MDEEEDENTISREIISPSESPMILGNNKFDSTINSRDDSIQIMQNSGLGAVLARENFVNPATAIPSAISSLVHSIYGSIFVSLFKDKNTE